MRQRFNRWLSTQGRLLLGIIAVVLILPFVFLDPSYLLVATTVTLLGVLMVYYVCLFEKVDDTKAQPAFLDEYFVSKFRPGRCYSIRFQKPPRDCVMAPGETITGNAFFDSTILTPMLHKIFILKADDLGNPVSFAFRDCIDVIYHNNAKISLSIIVRDYSPFCNDRIVRALGRLKRLIWALLTLNKNGNIHLMT